MTDKPIKRRINPDDMATPTPVDEEVTAQIARHRQRRASESQASGKRSESAKQKWARDHPTTSYRIPVATRDAVRELADEYGLTADELAGYLLDLGVAAVRSRQFKLKTVPRQRNQIER